MNLHIEGIRKLGAHVEVEGGYIIARAKRLTGRRIDFNVSRVMPPFLSSDWWLEGMHFPSPTEGWAVGGDWQKGTLLHYSLWPMDFSSKLSVKGFAKDSNPTDGTCHTYSDGTFYIYEDDHGTPRYYTGTYSLAPDGKTILFTFDSNAFSAMEAMLAERVAAVGTNEGVSVEAISFVFNPVSSFKGSIQKKTNAPSTLTIKITGTVNASSDYRGEISVLLMNAGHEPFTVRRGDRVAQLVVAPVVQAQLVEVATLDAKERGAGGFGHTGIGSRGGAARARRRST